MANPDVVFVSDDASSNSLGRVYCLWLLANELGISSTVVAASGDSVWAPLRGTKFSESVRIGLSQSEMYTLRPHTLVCVKTLPLSFELAQRWSRDCAIPVVLDIDDPDIEAGLGDGSPLKKVGKAVLRPRTTAAFRRMRTAAPALPVIVSNPYLAETYGGTVIPHVRQEFGPNRLPDRSEPVVAFVGTSRRHKGLGLLREAVARSQRHGYRLVITDVAPDDPKPWEEWVGRTSISEGLEIVKDADVIVVPSRDTAFSRGQLPAKLIDAMMAGRAVAASDLPTIRWALAGTGLLFPPESLDGLVEALEELADPRVRVRLGAAARARALSEFTIERNAAAFASVLDSVRGPE